MREQNKWSTADDVAQFFKVKRQTVHLWAREGMPCFRGGQRLVRFDIRKVQQWLEHRYRREAA